MYRQYPIWYTQTPYNQYYVPQYQIYICHMMLRDSISDVCTKRVGIISYVTGFVLKTGVNELCTERRTSSFSSRKY